MLTLASVLAMLVVLLPGLVAGPAFAQPIARPPDAVLSLRVAERIAATLPGTIVQSAADGDARVQFPTDRWSIAVGADDGMVRLSGEVPDFMAAREVIDVARRVRDVDVVKNELTVPRPGVRDNPYGAFPYGYPGAILPEYWPGAMVSR